MTFIAVSKVKYPPLLKDKIHAFGLSMIPIAKLQHGLISVSFNQSLTENETLMFWEWATQADHEACMESKDWAELMSASGELFQSDGVEFLIESYERLA